MSGLGFRVLGPLEVVRDGEAVPINGPKLRVLLAALLVRPNATVSVDQLAERLWGERPPATARKSTQVYALRLRRMLSGDALIETRPDGYRIRLEPGQLDLLCFRTLTGQATRAGSPAEELRLLTEALACWRGPALSDVPSESMQREDAVQLAEERLRTRDRYFEVSLDQGHHREIIGELGTLTREHPWQESFWAQLILALHRSGRRADALDTYRGVHRMFTEELGVEPGARLQQVHRTILAEDGDGVPAADPVPPRLAICQLPADVNRFVGRSAPIDALTGMSIAGPRPGWRWRNVVISGPPGVGKTALAVHVAHLFSPSFADGQLYVNLQGYAADPPLAPAAVLTRFLGTLGVPRERIPADVEEQAALFRSVLSGRKMLLLLDNAVSADQIRPLLPGQPGCAVLVTSRHDLRGLSVDPGADHLPLGVLTEAESHTVLADLLGAARAEAEPEAIAGLARACAHLPLALRIAGANLAADPGRGIADYTAELTTSGRLAELTIDGDERSAVRVAFDHSYLRLSEADRRLFRLLGLTPGQDVGVPAAAALVDTAPADTGRALDRLTAANLLQRPARGRYQFHDLIREYAVDRSRAEDSEQETAAALTRLIDLSLHTAAAAVRLLYPGVPHRVLPDPEAAVIPLPTEAAALNWLDQERDNLVATITWTASHPVLHRYAWQFADVLRTYLLARAHDQEALAGCAAALRAAIESGDRAAQISLLDVLGQMSLDVSDYDSADTYQQQVLATARETGDLMAEAEALRNLGLVLGHRGQPLRALLYHRDALVVARRAGNTGSEILALSGIGNSHASAGRPRTALKWHERAVSAAREAGNRGALFRALNGRGLAYWALGRPADAIADHSQVLAYSREIDLKVGEVVSLTCLAEARYDAEELDLAMADATESLRLSAEVGDRRCEASAMEIIATVRNGLGEHDAAIEGYLAALRIDREIGFGYGERASLIGLAKAHRGLGDARRAIAYCEQALARMRVDGELLLEAAGLTELGHDHLDLGDPVTASRLVSQAIGLAAERGQALAESRARDVLGLIRQVQAG